MTKISTDLNAGRISGDEALSDDGSVSNPAENALPASVSMTTFTLESYSIISSA
jgi:hypothetical protein